MNKHLTPMQEKVLKVLSKSKKPMSRAKLQFAVYGSTDNRNRDRAIQGIIYSLRRLGYVIVSNSDHNGYKIANTKAEVDRYVAEREKAAKQMIKTARRVRLAFQQLTQMQLTEA